MRKSQKFYYMGNICTYTYMEHFKTHIFANVHWRVPTNTMCVPGNTGSPAAHRNTSHWCPFFAPPLPHLSQFKSQIRKMMSNQMRWEIFYLGNGGRKMWIPTCRHVTSIRSLSVLTSHALVRHSNPTQRDYVKLEAVFLVFISYTSEFWSELPPPLQ